MINKRVFPMVFISLTQGKWRSWSHYTNVLATEIKSLQDYLNYFNPDYWIINDTLKGELNDIYPEESKSLYNQIKKRYKVTNDDGVIIETGYIIFPGYLSYRQGFYNDENSNTYIVYNQNLANVLTGEEDAEFTIDTHTIKSDDIGRNSDNSLLNIQDQDFNIIKNIFVPFTPSTTIISNKWTHSGIEDYTNPERWNADSYHFIARSEPAFYIIEGAEKALRAKLYQDGLSTVGSNIFFCLDTFPTRYFLQNPEEATWGDTGTEGVRWSREAAYWNNEGSAPILKIADKQGKVWLNSYPLMHKLQIVDDDVHESFITDDVWSVEKTNIANHTTTRYTINVENLDNEKANFKDLGVRTLII